MFRVVEKTLSEDARWQRRDLRRQAVCLARLSNASAVAVTSLTRYGFMIHGELCRWACAVLLAHLVVGLAASSFFVQPHQVSSVEGRTQPATFTSESPSEAQVVDLSTALRWWALLRALDVRPLEVLVHSR